MDAAEFKQQFLPYHRKLYRTAFRLTENPQEAEDMVQEAYLKLWNKRDELASVLNTEAYCVTLVKNLCYDALRRSRPDEDGHAPEELNLPTDTNIAREVEQRDEVNQVRRLIGRLPEQQKRVILLRDVNDCSFEEIEQATGLNAINIRVLLSRAPPAMTNRVSPVTASGKIRRGARFPARRVMRRRKRPITVASVVKVLLIQKFCVVSVRKKPASTAKMHVRHCSRAVRKRLFAPGLSRA